ncbi:MAG: TetR/AcrR family transcriptional regulator [Chitinophagales bacterium]
MAKAKQIEKDLSTEEKIKTAAKKLFTKNGFEATRTRDIAEEAGINLALLNYYFRSKQKLFEIVMKENIVLFISGMLEDIEHKAQMTASEKLELFIDRYIDMLIANPDLPFFMISVSRNESFFMDEDNDPIAIEMRKARSSFLPVLIEFVGKKNIEHLHPMHIMANFMALIVFPFAASNMLRYRAGKISKTEFEKLMIERKKLIPVWLKNMYSAVK